LRWITTLIWDSKRVKYFACVFFNETPTQECRWWKHVLL
jgi:hypothetical protein